MRKRGKINFIGTFAEKVGRPMHINGPYDPGRRMMQHELWTTDALWHIPLEQIKRWKDVDEELRPDAEHEQGGTRYLWELDTGEQTHLQVTRRWQAYREINASMSAFLLVVTVPDGRLEQLIERAKPFVGNIALFTTLRRIINETPYAEIWTDCFGRTVALPR